LEAKTEWVLPLLNDRLSFKPLKVYCSTGSSAVHINPQQSLFGQTTLINSRYYFFPSTFKTNRKGYVQSDRQHPGQKDFKTVSAAVKGVGLSEWC